MTIFTDPAQLADAWRRMTDTANENGETPVFALGLGSFLRSGLLNLVALGRLARQNLGLQYPVVIAGAESWLWLSAMFVWQPTSGPKRRSAGAAAVAKSGARQDQTEEIDSAGRTVLYAGADVASYAAVLNLADRNRDRKMTPAGLDWSRTPSTSPCVEGAAIELLPAVVTPELTLAPVSSSQNTWLQKGERWAGVALALVLLLAAFFG